MPYADELVRVTVTYSPPPADNWTGELAVTTFHLRHHHITGNGFTWADQMQHLPQMLHDKYAAHWASEIGASALATGAQIVQFKTAHIDSAGHTLEEGAYDVSDGSLTGSGGTGMLPPEVALCVSTWSYQPGGFAAHKGRKRARMYLPYIATNLCGNDGKVRVPYASALATAFQGLFNDIQGMHTFNEDTPPDPNPDYWDLVTASKVDGSWANVDYVSVDDHFDSQRRRQHQTPATRYVQPITHA